MAAIAVRKVNLQIEIEKNYMLKNIKIAALLAVFFSLFSTHSFAQLQKGQLVDGIAAVVGNEIVLESDVSEQMAFEAQQGNPAGDRCQFMQRIINNKVLIFEAKQDTLIENRSAYIKDLVNNKYTQILAGFPDERTMLDAYKFRSSYEMKNAIERIDTDQYYMQAKYARITEKADVTPSEVTDFYNMYQTQFPMVKEEVSLAQISIYPELTEAHKQELIDRLNKIKQDIQNGESFESQARIYSEDPGSAAKGGLYTNVSKGQMVKQFEAAALNLQEGEISDPVLTDFGYHIIQLVKRSGNRYDARHILLTATPNDDEIATARKKLDSIRTLIDTGKMTFREAAVKFSDDKQTKFNGGMLINQQDGSNRIEKETLSPEMAYELAGINKGDMSEVYENQLNQKKAVSIMKVEDIIPAHSVSLESDYDRIKQMALNKKKNDMLQKWVTERTPGIFITIDKRYGECSMDPALQRAVAVQ